MEINRPEILLMKHARIKPAVVIQEERVYIGGEISSQNGMDPSQIVIEVYDMETSEHGVY